MGAKSRAVRMEDVISEACYIVEEYDWIFDVDFPHVWRINPYILEFKPGFQKALAFYQANKPNGGIEPLVLTVALSIIETREDYERHRATKPAKRSYLASNYDHLFKAIGERDGFKCKRCNKLRKLSIDHIFPLSLGGTNDLRNLQLLCQRCNSRKGARIDD